jgi:hypothetical protein
MINFILAFAALVSSIGGLGYYCGYIAAQASKPQKKTKCKKSCQ